MRKVWIPNQHGAWAMLIVPYILAIWTTTPRWEHILLAAIWLLGYLAVFPLLLWIRTGKGTRSIYPILIYGTPAMLLGLWLCVRDPMLLGYLPMVLPLFLVNVYYAKKNQERALVNDFAAVALFGSIVYPVHLVGGELQLKITLEVFGLHMLYFVSTVFFVKSMIREKRNRRFYLSSVLYHLGALVVIGLVGGQLLVWGLFVLLLIKAIGLPRTRITIIQTGILEIVLSVLLLVAVGYEGRI